MMSIYEGLVAGLVIAAGFGPAFLFMMQTGIERGMRPALAVALGITMCDIILMLLALTSSGFIAQSVSTRWLGIVGGTILTGMGIVSMLKPSPKESLAKKTSQGSNLRQLTMKGFMINIGNPFNFIFWVGLTSLAASRHPAGIRLWGFLAGVVVMELISTWLKCKIASLFSSFVTPRALRTINYSMGGIFIISGFYIFYTSMMAV